MQFGSRKRGNKEEIRGERKRERENPLQGASESTLSPANVWLFFLLWVLSLYQTAAAEGSAQIVKCARPSPLRWNELGRGAARHNSLHSVALPTQHLTSSLLSTHHSLHLHLASLSPLALTFFIAMDVRTLDPTGLYWARPSSHSLSARRHRLTNKKSISFTRAETIKKVQENGQPCPLGPHRPVLRDRGNVAPDETLQKGQVTMEEERRRRRNPLGTAPCDSQRTDAGRPECNTTVPSTS